VNFLAIVSSRQPPKSKETLPHPAAYMATAARGGAEGL